MSCKERSSPRGGGPRAPLGIRPQTPRVGQSRLVRIPTPRAAFWQFELADLHPSGHFLPPVTLRFGSFLDENVLRNGQFSRQKCVSKHTPPRTNQDCRLRRPQRDATPCDPIFGRFWTRLRGRLGPTDPRGPRGAPTPGAGDLLRIPRGGAIWECSGRVEPEGCPRSPPPGATFLCT